MEELHIPRSSTRPTPSTWNSKTGQGFDLTPYCGKRVKRYTYAVSNYPTVDRDPGRPSPLPQPPVIGGDILSADLGGFIHGLAMP